MKARHGSLSGIAEINCIQVPLPDFAMSMKRQFAERLRSSVSKDEIYNL
jgi:hypothetical protein